MLKAWINPNPLALNDTYSEYLRSLRSIARGVWKGVIDYFQAYDSLDLAIKRGITKAWYEGLKEAGIEPAEMNEDEKAALRGMIVNETVRIDNLIDYCDKNSQANGGKWGTCDSRVKMWALRAKEAKSTALTMAKSDPKLIWTLGATEEHCKTCNKLHSKVKRASYWARIGVKPQNPPNPMLECQGYYCDCSLSPTEEPLSKGTLGNFP